MRVPKGLSAVTLALVVALAACGGEYPQSSIDPKSDFAHSIHTLYVGIFWITLVILIVVWGVMGYIVVKFRARPGSPPPRQIRGHLGMELMWTLLPALIVIAIAVPSVQTLFRTQSTPAVSALTVEVIGHQFWWEFRYPGGRVVTANDLHLPVGRPIALRLRSADVIHSFWVPQLGGKRDLVPERARPEGAPADHANWLFFRIQEAGIYRGQCAEFCGPSHALMGIRVVAESGAEFAAWLADMQRSEGSAADSAASAAAVEVSEAAEQADAQARLGGLPRAAADSAVIAAAGAPGGGGAARVELGRQTFHAAACVACHAIQGTTAAGRVGPNLTLFGRRQTVAGWLENTPDNLVKWITSPQSVKPGAHMPGVAEPGGNFPPTNLSDEQVRAVAEYLWSLGK